MVRYNLRVRFENGVVVRVPKGARVGLLAAFLVAAGALTGGPAHGEVNTPPPESSTDSVAPGSPQPQSITITNPSGPVDFGETDEYATLEWNDPWDMSQPLDVRQLDSPACVYPNHFDEVTPCPEGVWCAQVRSDVGNPDLFLLHPGYSGAMHIGRDGHLLPIDAGLYKQLTFRMYISSVDAADPGFQVYWTDGTVADIGGDPARYGGSHLYKTYAGWNIYSIDLSLETAPLNGSHTWSGQLTGLRLDPGLVNMNGKTVDIDWVRLTPRTTRRVQWNTGDAGNITIEFQLAGSGEVDPLRMYTINGGSTAPVSIPASQGTYDVPASLPPGDWNVHLATSASTAGPAGPWQVQAAPSLQFLRPGLTSGEEYSVYELSDAWDMGNPEDVYYSGNLSGAPAFTGGLLNGTSADTDPDNDCSAYWEDPFLNWLDDVNWEPSATDPPMDTAKYRYLTFRLKVDGTPDVSYGWVARVVWSDMYFANCGITNDIPLHADWNQVSIDLWAEGVLDDLDPCQSPWQSSPQRYQLRLDPMEVPVPTTFSVDYIALTAADTAARDSVYAVKYLPGPTAETITFYYDTDTNPANGRTLAAEYLPPAPAPGPYVVFVPLAPRRASFLTELPPGVQTFLWDLGGVAAGTYYLSAVASNGYNTATWYSETPVTVTP